jgi:uncharacterized oligopeptide transporter (OPT) family protein
LAHEPSPPAHLDAANAGVAAEDSAGSDSGRLACNLEPSPPDLTSPQFTLRAILTGVVLASLLSVCNVYVGLNIGAGFPMSITAALLGYGFWSAVRAGSGQTVRRWGILENNISQTASSSGASVASAGLVAAIPALTLLTGRTLAWHFLALWVLSVMLVGIVVAIPLRRQMVVVEKLRFPAGMASAEMLREMHARGREALARVKVLAAAGLVGAGVKLCTSFHVLTSYALPFSIKGFSARSLAMTLNPSLLPLGIGGLIGFRACCSLLIGAILAYVVVAPSLLQRGYIQASEPLSALPSGIVFPENERHIDYDAERHVLECSLFMTAAERDELLALSADQSYRAAVQKLHATSQSAFECSNRWLLWPGVTLMVVASLVSLCFSWRSIVAALPAGGGRPKNEPGLSDAGDVPRRWFAVGLLAALILSVVLQVSLFGIVWWAAVVGVLLAFALAVVAARVSGETGIGTVGPMGKVAQLAFGLVVPRNPVPNLMAANVAGGAASQCADLLDDLKCGHLLGASPRLQTLAQLCGAVAGALVGSAAYLILIPNPGEMIASGEWAAPAVKTWKAVAELFMVGFGALPRGTPTAMGLAALAGVALPALERGVPSRFRRLVLSAVAIGLGFVCPAQLAISIFIGGLLALILRRWFESWSARFLIAMCVGLIAGESLTGIGIALGRVLTR